MLQLVSNTWLAVLLCSAAALFFLAAWAAKTLLPAFKKLREDAARVSQCGVLSPPPSDRSYLRSMKVARFVCYAFVGKIRTIGAEKLAELPSPFVLAFNHGSMLDVAIAPVVLSRKARFPAAQGVMKAFGGLVGLLFSKWGVYSVDLDNGHAALDASVKVLCSGDGSDIVVIFPEAWTNTDGIVRRFKTGAVRMACEASSRLGKPVPIVPGYMHYGRYPGSWITKLPIPVQWLIPIVFAFYFRRGVTVQIGEPIYPADLPADPRDATEILRQKVIALAPAK